MKRTLLLGVAVLALLSTGAHAATVTTTQSRTVFVGGSSGSNFLFLQAFNYDDPVQNSFTPIMNGFVFVQIGNSTANAQGPITITLDPLSQVGHVAGTLPAQPSGTITISLDFLATQLVPYQYQPGIEIVPTPPPEATINFFINRGGRFNGTVTSSAIGTFNAVNLPGSANVASYLIVKS